MQILGIKSSGKFSPTHRDVDVLFDLEWPYFYTEQSSCFGQWIMIWLEKDYYIDLEGYSMKGSVDTEYPTHWKFSVSSDGEKWKDIHASSIAVSLNGNIYKVKAKAVKYFKWTITGVSADNRDYVLLGCLDLYGKYYSIKTQKYKKNYGLIKSFFIA